MTDHTATLDRNDPEQATQRNARWFVRTEARLIVTGGLACPTPDQLDQRVRDTLHSHQQLDVSRADAALLAVALIRGYATTHPRADAAELDYVADRRAVRRLYAARRHRNRSRRAFADARRAVLELHRAFVGYAHPVHNPVENNTGVVRAAGVAPWQRTTESRRRALAHVRAHVAAGDLLCNCHDWSPA